MKKCYLICTDRDGHLYCDYTTKDLMTLDEALKKLEEILEVDPDAVLARVDQVEKVDHSVIMKFRGKDLAG